MGRCRFLKRPMVRGVAGGESPAASRLILLPLRAAPQAWHSVTFCGCLSSVDKTPIHKEFAVWLAAQMAARGFNHSDLARAIWGTIKDTRGYDVARNRDRIGAYLSGNSYPELDTVYALAEAFSVFPDDIPRSGRPSRRVVFRAKQHPPRVSPATLINQKLDRILALLERAMHRASTAAIAHDWDAPKGRLKSRRR
jgi:hypothetical protein